MSEKKNNDAPHWHLDKIGVSHQWEKTRGDGVAIALFDSGVDIREGAAKRQLKGAVDEDRSKDYTVSRHHSAKVDEYGHGTKMAAILCARSSADPLAWNRCRGVAPEAGLLNLKVAHGDGSVSEVGVLEAADYVCRVKKREIPVALLALGWDLWRNPTRSPPLLEALGTLVQNNILPILAAGDSPVGINLDRGDLLWSGLSDRIVVVGASRREGGTHHRPTEPRKAAYLTENSNFGPESVHIAAPGQDIPTLTPMAPGMAYGTSAAAAIVAGAAALLAAADSSLRGDDLRAAILENSRPDNLGKSGLPGVEKDRILGFRGS